MLCCWPSSHYSFSLRILYGGGGYSPFYQTYDRLQMSSTPHEQITAHQITYHQHIYLQWHKWPPHTLGALGTNLPLFITCQVLVSQLQAVLTNSFHHYTAAKTLKLVYITHNGVHNISRSLHKLHIKQMFWLLVWNNTSKLCPFRNKLPGVR
jgi:hypothetical protein